MTRRINKGRVTIGAADGWRNDRSHRELESAGTRRHGWVRGVKRGAAVAAIGLALAGPALSGRAELRWLEPEIPVVTPGATVWVGLTSGALFGSPGAPVPTAAMRAFSATLVGQPLVAGPAVVTSGFTRCTLTLPRPGVAVIVSDLVVERREIQNGYVERYLRTMYVTDEVRARWAEEPAESAWRELRHVRLKTYVRVGQPPPEDRSWTVARADGLDLVPQVDPTANYENADFAVRLTRDGQPVGGCIVSFLSRGENREHVELTDAAGQARARLDARGGWFVRGVQIRRVTASDHDWATDVVGMTLYVP